MLAAAEYVLCQNNVSILFQKLMVEEKKLAFLAL